MPIGSKLLGRAKAPSEWRKDAHSLKERFESTTIRTDPDKRYTLTAYVERFGTDRPECQDKEPGFGKGLQPCSTTTFTVVIDYDLAGKSVSP